MLRQSKSTMNLAALIAKNSIVQVTAGVVNKLLGVVLIIYAARQLGTVGFGQYTFTLSLLTIFYIFADFGLGTLITRDVARQPRQETRYFGNVFMMRLALSILAGLGMIITVWAMGNSRELIGLATIAAISIFFTSNVDTGTAIFNAHQRMEIPAAVSVTVTLIRVTASLGALVGGAGVWLLICIQTLAAALQLGMILWVLFYFIRPRFEIDWRFWKKIFQAAYPLALANIFYVVYFRVDTVLLAYFQGQAAVGLYNAAYRLLELTLILPAYYCGAIFPVISSSFKQNQQRFLLIYRRSMKYMWLVSLPLAAGTSVLAAPFIQVLYGQDYAASVPILRILMWTLVLIAINSINAPYLITMGRQRTATVVMSMGMLANIGMNLLAIPRFGMLGAAWVTLLSEGLNLMLFLAVLRRDLHLDFSLLRHLLRPALAAGIMYAVLGFIPTWDLGIQILIGAIIYGLGLWLLRAFDEVDLELFQRVIKPKEPGRLKLT